VLVSTEGKARKPLLTSPFLRQPEELVLGQLDLLGSGLDRLRVVGPEHHLLADPDQPRRTADRG
jgi:hypothetical protein